MKTISSGAVAARANETAPPGNAFNRRNASGAKRIISDSL
jgi:hypothetical protein